MATQLGLSVTEAAREPDTIEAPPPPLTTGTPETKPPAPPPNPPPSRIVFFDVDDTLYAKSLPVKDLVMGNIVQYCIDNYGFSPSAAQDEVVRLWKSYGITLRGLQATQQVDVQHYLDFIHGTVDIEGIVKPVPPLTKMLETLRAAGVQIWTATNADARHAKRVLKALAIDHLFDGVFYVDSAAPGYVCKPDDQYWRKALAAAAVGPDTEVFFVDDSKTNCASARRFGWRVAFVDEEGGRLGAGLHDWADVTVAHAYDLLAVWPELGSAEALPNIPSIVTPDDSTLEGLVGLLRNQIRSSTWLADNPATGPSLDEIAARERAARNPAAAGPTLHKSDSLTTFPLISPIPPPVFPAFAAAGTPHGAAEEAATAEAAKDPPRESAQ